MIMILNGFVMETDIREIDVESGEPFFIEELQEMGNTAKDYLEKSVCVVGRLSRYDSENCEASLTDSHTNAHLNVNTALIEPFGAKLGSVLQMIGELEIGGGFPAQGLVLKARVVKCVDMLDMAIYRKAIQHQRMHLATKLI